MFFIPPFALRAAGSLHDFCQRWMPSNIVVRRVSGRARWSGAALLVALGVLYLAVAVICATLVQQGHDAWWNLGFLLGFRNAIKFVGHGVRLGMRLVAVQLRHLTAGHRAHVLR